MELDKMDENEWKYHGEGNKSLVVSHVQDSRVLRLLKYPTEDAEHTHQSTEQAFKHIQNIVEYSKHVMKPLLGEKWVHHGEAVRLPLDFVRQLSLKVQQERPESRCNKVIDTFSGCALCLPNFTQLSACRFGEHRPQLCIEIKPKCGFLPSSPHITNEIKLKVCRFCMHQHFKLANGKWRRISRYCPLDLFSGNKQRMYYAIKHLLEEPQNNLKIFKGGQLIYGCRDAAEQQQDLNELVQHLRSSFFTCAGPNGTHVSSGTVLGELIQALSAALLSSPGHTHTGEHRRGHAPEGRSHCEAHAPPCEHLRSGTHCLPRDCVLYRILQTQMLDNLDVEGIYPLYRRVEQYLKEFPKERLPLQMDGPYNEKFLEKVKNCPGEDDGSIEYAVGKIHQYRVAMTAKDCSILIALTPSGEDQRLDPDLEKHPRLSHSVSILDLDPKPYENIAHQYKLDSKIVNHYVWKAQAERDQPEAPRVYVESQDCTLLFQPV